MSFLLINEQRQQQANQTAAPHAPFLLPGGEMRIAKTAKHERYE
jgi:hypothetical protein